MTSDTHNKYLYDAHINSTFIASYELEFHRHRISSLIKRWTREQTKERWMTEAMQVKRWISEQVKARWTLHELN